MWSRSPRMAGGSIQEAAGMNQYGIVLVGQLRAQGGQAAHGGLNIPGEGATGKQGGFPDRAAPKSSRCAQDLEGMAATVPARGRGCKIRSMGRPPGIRLQSTGAAPPGECHGEYNPP